MVRTMREQADNIGADRWLQIIVAIEALRQRTDGGTLAIRRLRYSVSRVLGTSNAAAQDREGRTMSWLMHGVLRFCFAGFLGIVTFKAHGTEAWTNQADWERTIALAKQEGAIALSGPVGTTWRAALTSFERDYPIKVDYTPARAHEFWPRYLLERKLGKNLWDLRLTPGDVQAFHLLREGKAIVAARDLLVVPEVTRDASWLGGFDSIFTDRAKRYFIGYGLEALPIAWVNRDIIPEAELPQFRELADAKWKGKVSIQDLRSAATTANLAVLLRAPEYGEKFLDEVIIKNDAVIVQNSRQQVEWLVRGRYPIGIGVLSSLLLEFKQHGLAANVVPLTDIPKYSSGAGGLIALHDAPHPNAAKLYANWLLGREAQTRIARTVDYNSRRTDVPVQQPAIAVDRSRIDQYVNTQSEDMLPYLEQAMEYAQKVAKLGTKPRQ